MICTEGKLNDVYFGFFFSASFYLLYQPKKTALSVNTKSIVRMRNITRSNPIHIYTCLIVNRIICYWYIKIIPRRKTLQYTIIFCLSWLFHMVNNNIRNNMQTHIYLYLIDSSYLALVSLHCFLLLVTILKI